MAPGWQAANWKVPAWGGLICPARVSPGNPCARAGSVAAISAERIYSVDSFNLAGSYEEQMMLIDDIRADLTRQILQRIESTQLEAGV